MRHTRNQTRARNFALGSKLCLPIALAAVALWAPAAHAGLGFGGGNGDAVGSLPSMNSSGPGSDEHGVLDPVSDQFRLVLMGDEAQLEALVMSARRDQPNAWVTKELLGNGLARVVYAGDVSLEIDRALLESSFVAVQLELGPVFGGGSLAITAGGKVARTAAVPGVLPVHLQQLSSGAPGLLDAGVELRATTTQGKQRALDASTGGAKGEKILLKLGS